MADRLRQFWERFRPCFRTRTRDQSLQAWNYLSALLRMEQELNFTAIGRVSSTSGQTVQHFMSNSPWSAASIHRQVQEEVKATPALGRGGLLILDESADEKAGPTTVGAGRQYNGRLGKIEMSQVGTFLAFAHPAQNVWCWIDGELFLPEAWFTPEKAALRERLGVPESRTFQTKVELGWAMIDRVHRRGVPFEAVCCDELYGRKDTFRSRMARSGIVYMAGVPATTRVCRTPAGPAEPVTEIARDPALPYERGGCVRPSGERSRIGSRRWRCGRPGTARRTRRPGSGW